MSFRTPPAYDGFTGTVTSKDGTVIAFDRAGDGPPVILVDGVTFHRAYGPMRALAGFLRTRGFTVYAYDRRGRGESTDTTPYAPEREVEDLLALIQDAGGSAHLFAATSGVVVALDAANAGSAVRSLVAFDPPFVVDGSRRPLDDGFQTRFNELVAAGRLDDAQALYVAGQVPAFRPLIPLLRRLPSWRRSLPYIPSVSRDIALFAGLQAGQSLPTERWNNVTAPALVATSIRSPRWTRQAARALADLLPGARLHLIRGQGHLVKQAALAPLLADFFDSQATDDR